MPPELKRGPFTTAQARAAGVTPSRLGRAPWHRLYQGIYVWDGLGADLEVLVSAAEMRIPPRAAFSGLTAAAIHGLDVARPEMLEVTIPYGGSVSGRAHLVVRRTALAAGDVTTVRGHRVTSVVRTLQDLSRRSSLTEAVVLVDMALHLGLTTLEQLCRVTTRPALRRVLAHAEPLSESPMETRLRMLLVLAGLPRPCAQVPITDASGRLLGRVDLYYPEARLAIEYDGATHRESLAADDERQNRLIAHGLRILRFTRADMRDEGRGIVRQVRALLPP